jgi:uncharacterized protein (TIGR02266 family)
VELRRADRRYERRIDIEFSYEGQSHSGHTRNLSLGGVFIETDVVLPFGARLQVRFRLPTQTEWIEVEGQVRWCDTSDEVRGMGVRFEGLRARDVWALNKFFHQRA